MPIYEYVCHGCGNEFEALVRSDTIAQCPSCHSTELKKLLSVFATAQPGTQAAPVVPNPCASCGNLRGPGACALND